MDLSFHGFLMFKLWDVYISFDPKHIKKSDFYYIAEMTGIIYDE